MSILSVIFILVLYISVKRSIFSAFAFINVFVTVFQLLKSNISVVVIVWNFFIYFDNKLYTRRTIVSRNLWTNLINMIFISIRLIVLIEIFSISFLTITILLTFNISSELIVIWFCCEHFVLNVDLIIELF